MTFEEFVRLKKVVVPSENELAANEEPSQADEGSVESNEDDVLSVDTNTGSTGSVECIVEEIPTVRVRTSSTEDDAADGLMMLSKK